MEKQVWLIVLVLTVLASTIISNAVLISYTSQYERVPDLTVGSAIEAVLSFCINLAPVINNTCANQTNQSANYSCYLGATDADTNTTLAYSSSFVSNYTLFIINSSTGYFSFTPNQTHVGNHSVLLTVNDLLGCTNSQTSELFTFEVLNVNDPPYLVQPLLNQTFENTSQVRNIFLNDYFDDPDGDPLSYVYNYVGSGNVNINFNGDEIIFTSTSCGYIDYVYFTAVDPENLSANSNTISVEVTCPEDTDDGGGDGSGGGGGGGSGSERDCTPEWQCGDWSACYPNGTQKRRCIDINGCDADNYIQWTWRECNYSEQPCQENWVCSGFGPCIDGWQNQTCEDINECGSFDQMPNLSQSCYVNETCLNGIQDPGETGIDCGGPCPPCKVEEGADIIQPDETWRIWTTIFLILLLLIAMLLLFYRLYHKQVNRWLVRLGWWLTKRRPKAILLDKETKELLLGRLRKLEHNLATYTPAEAAVAFGSLVRIYMAKAFHIDRTFKHEEFKKAITLHAMPENLKKILASFYSQANHVEFGQYKPKKQEFVALVDEFRQTIFQTSRITKEEMAAQIKERHIQKGMHPMDILFVQISNAQIATMYAESAIAKEMYMKLITEYETLQPNQQAIVYRYLARLYEEIGYVAAQV